MNLKTRYWNHYRLWRQAGAPWLIGLCLFSLQAFAGEPAVKELDPPAPKNSLQHHLGKLLDGRLLISWVEKTKTGKQAFRFSIRQNGAWSAPQTVATADKLLDRPAVVELSSHELGAGWVEAKATAKDPNASAVYLARSADGGRTWSTPEQASRNAHAYPYHLALAATVDDGLSAVWSDGRGIKQVTGNNGKKSYIGNQALVGTVLDAQAKVGPEVTLDADICSCCQPDTVSTADGLMTVYRDHGAGELRDIVLVSWNAQAAGTPAVVHKDGWKIDGCPSNGPAIDASGEQVVVAWFTGANGQPRVNIAFSNDSGKHFKDPVQLEGEAAIGYVDTRLLADGSALVSWRRRDTEGPAQELRVAKVSVTGEPQIQTLVSNAVFAKYPSEIPWLEQADGQTFMIWTDPKAKRLRLVSMP